MEDPIHYPGSTEKNNKRRGRAGGNAASKNPSAQETNNRPRQDNLGRQRIKEYRNPKKEERDYITDQRIVETGLGSAGDYPKSQHVGIRGNEETDNIDRRF
jgi:hypothetical protein